jgi:hypothetical protein
MIKLNLYDVALVASNELAGLPALIEVQIDEILYGDSPGTHGILIGYSAKVVGSKQSWLVLPEDIVYKYPIN